MLVLVLVLAFLRVVGDVALFVLDVSLDVVLNISLRSGAFIIHVRLRTLHVCKIGHLFGFLAISTLALSSVSYKEKHSEGN